MNIVYLFTLSTDKQSFTIMTTSASMMRMEERLPHNEADEHVSIDASDDDTQETSDVAHAQHGEWYPHNGVTHGNHTTEVRLGRQVSVACTQHTTMWQWLVFTTNKLIISNIIVIITFC